MTATAEIELSQAERIERAIIAGDLAGINEAERIAHYNRVCTETGLNPVTRPLAYIVLDGRLQLYCLKAGAEQLRILHKISIERIERCEEDANHVVTVYAKTGDGRSDVDVGAVSLVEPKERRDPRTGRMEANPMAGQPLSAADAANARKTAVTQAKRRVTLSLAGIGMLDESQVDQLVAEGRAFRPGEQPASRPARATGRPELRVVESTPDVFAFDGVPCADGPAQADPAPVAAAAAELPPVSGPDTAPAPGPAPIVKTAEIRLGWDAPTGEPVTPPPTTVPVVKGELPGGPMEEDAITVHVDPGTGLIDAALADLDATDLNPSNIDLGPVHGELRKLAANIKAAKAAKETETGPVPIGDITPAGAGDVKAAAGILAALDAVKHHPGRLAAERERLKGQIAALPEGTRNWIEAAYQAMRAAAQTSSSAKRR